MNILVIGNGFDLAHGLPTKYTDFLNFCTVVRKIYEDERLELRHYKEICLAQCGLNEEIEQQLLKVFDSREDHKDIDNNSGIIHTFTTKYPGTDELYALIQDNLWIEYFLPVYKNREKAGKNGWIDFESEISGVVQSIDDDMHGLSQIYDIEDIVYNLSNGFLEEKYSDYIAAVQPINPANNICSEGITFKEIRDRLLDDLNRLIRAFEIYLAEYVERNSIKVISPDIEQIVANLHDDRVQRGILFSKVISFNYTNIYEQVYLSKYIIDHSNYIDYIHGKADISNTNKTNNMVLGIDEYLGKKRRNREVDFIAFKKFYQRIHKQTGCKYKKWVELIQKDSERQDTWIYNNQDHSKDNFHNLYIFGHSLDVTDKDILRDLILNDNVYTTIFYHNKDTMGQQIANLVKVIGQNELIRRTGGSTKTIEFKLQQPMVERRVN